MSRIGRVPIEIPQGVEVKMDGVVARIKGPKGEMLRSLHPNMIVKVDSGKVNVSRPNDERLNKGLHGLTRTLVNNMILGVSMIAVCEAFVLADQLGLDPQKLFEISSNASGQCWSLTQYCPWPNILHTHACRKHTPNL